jgi:Asp-tRNA(Asn)/Glu-tRNA(Gln) amidotransferase A subunit family amidase
MNPAQLTAAQAARLIRAGNLKSEDLVRACLERIAARDGEVRAWTHYDAELALRRARELDRAAGPRAPLHGIPVGVKDVIDTADLPTQYGSPIYRGFQPRADAACVSLARSAGAIILGKTATTEFASIHPAPTRNPLNLDHSPGGSSSGSAAAVADFMVPLAYGTQTAGSTIRPAAFCGVVGYKPSFNLINRAGLKFSAESLDTIGFFGRSVEDVALFAYAVSGQGMPDFEPSQPARIGVHRTPRWPTAEASAQSALEQAAQVLAAAGAVVEDFDLKTEFELLYEIQGVIMRYEAARAMAWETRQHRELLSAEFAERMDQGMAISRNEYQVAMTQAEQCRQGFAGELAGFDVLLTPSAVGEAPLDVNTTGDAVFNRNWTLLGVPCVHVPSSVGPRGLPLGVQVVGASGSDLETLRCAHWIEAALAGRSLGPADCSADT